VVQAQTQGLVNARVEISAAVAGSSATLEAIERQANARDRARQAEIAALQTRLTEAEAQGGAEVARLQAELIAAREALVADLTARDPAYAEAIAFFRREVTDIAASPEGTAALALYNAGDRVGALAVLDRIAAAEIRANQLAMESVARAAQVQMNRQAAAILRRNATLAMDAWYDNRTFDTPAVIARYEAVVRLDPDSATDWQQLFSLYLDAGRSGAALTAVERSLEINERLSAADPSSQFLAERVASLFWTIDRYARAYLEGGDFELALSLYQLSLEGRERFAGGDPATLANARDENRNTLMAIQDTLTRQGNDLSFRDLDGALLRYQRSLEINERLSATDPGSFYLADRMAYLLKKIGDVILRQGDLDGALSQYQRSLDLSEWRSAASPASWFAASNVSVSLILIGDVLLSQGDPEILRADADVFRFGHFTGQEDLDGALSQYQRSLEIVERLSAADPASEAFLRGEESVSLERIGDVLVRQRDLDGAMSRYQRSLEIRDRMSAADPSSADLARDVRVSRERIETLLNRSRVRSERGDRDGALSLHQRSLEFAERRYAADPASVHRALDVKRSLWSLFYITGERRLLERALEILRGLETLGALDESDRIEISVGIAFIEEDLVRSGQPED